MSFDYDRLYADTPEALGAPDPVLASVFDRLGPAPLRILDVGCGQGRDALVLGRRGHVVEGIDLAPNGIRDLEAAARREGLAVRGTVADIRGVIPEGVFDVVLIDRTLHMLAAADRLAVLRRMLACVRPGGLCLIVDERRHIAGFEAAAVEQDSRWQVDTRRGGYLFLRRGSAADAPADAPAS